MKEHTENDTHDYRDTIREAAELDEDKEARIALERERQTDAETAYEAFAVAASMGTLGMEETEANLLQLELAQELLYRFDPDARPRE
ncbi:MAG: hypothetical protein NC184_07335 [Roseburia sp.]|nr:hypothetical protein [Roseburia sp.]